MDKKCQNYGTSWCVDFECDECPVRNTEPKKPKETMTDIEQVREKLANQYCLKHFCGKLSYFGYDRNVDIRWQGQQIQKSFEFIDEILQTPFNGVTIEEVLREHER